MLGLVPRPLSSFSTKLRPFFCLSFFPAPLILRASMSSSTATAAATESPTSCPHFPFARPHDVQPAVEYTELRKNAPISQVTLWDGTHPFLVVKHKDITEVLTDDRLSKQRARPGFPEMSAGGKEAAKNKPTFVDMDPPDHGRQRGMVESVFSKESVDSMRPHIQKTVDDLLDTMIQHGSSKPINLVEKFSLPVPSYIIYGILGVPMEDLKFLTEQNAVRTNGSATASEASNANRVLLDYLAKLVDQRSAEARDDLISKLVVEQVRPGFQSSNSFLVLN